MNPQHLHTISTLGPFLRERIRGQDEAIEAICPELQVGELGLNQPPQPRASFLFVGPTGTGKTELARLFTQHLMGEDKLVRVDMSEYAQEDSIDRLIGCLEAPRGTLGALVAATGGTGTLLFDEFEKAHPKIHDLLLQLLDAGRVTLYDGTQVQFHGYYVVCTSNIGSGQLAELRELARESKERIVLEILRQNLRPELIGRFGQIVVFNGLDYEVQKDVCRKFIAEETLHLQQMGHALTVDHSAVGYLTQLGYSERYGARQMRHQVRLQIKRLIADNLIAGAPTHGAIYSDPLFSKLFIGRPQNDSAPAWNISKLLAYRRKQQEERA